MDMSTSGKGGLLTAKCTKYYFLKTKSKCFNFDA